MELTELFNILANWGFPILAAIVLWKWLNDFVMEERKARKELFQQLLGVARAAAEAASQASKAVDYNTIALHEFRAALEQVCNQIGMELPEVAIRPKPEDNYAD